jgi:hypothetical protein
MSAKHFTANTEKFTLKKCKINIPVKCLILFIKFIDALGKTLQFTKHSTFTFWDGTTLLNSAH